MTWTPRRLTTTTTAVAAALLLAACGLAGGLAQGYLDIEPADLQARLATRFPLHRCKTVLACLDLSHPVVVLREGDDRIAVEADVRLLLGVRERTGRVALSARPRYAPQEGQLFLDDLQVVSLELAGVPDHELDLVRDYGGLLARQALQSHPVYTLDAGTAKGALTRQVVKDVKVVQGRLRVVLAPAGG